jgi:hypothetical protein
MRPGDSGPLKLEEEFFSRENTRLLESLRKRSVEEQRRDLLRQVVRIRDEAFLNRLLAMGIGPETALALRLVPLVFVAWADHRVDERERDAVMRAAEQQGLVAEQLAQGLLRDWLTHEPDPRMLTLWKDYVGHIWNRFTPDEQWQMRKNLLESAREVAEAAGGFLGLAKISAAERALLDELELLLS